MWRALQAYNAGAAIQHAAALSALSKGAGQWGNLLGDAGEHFTVVFVLS